MSEISVLRELIYSDREKNVDRIRLEIANLIGKCLVEKRESLGYWEKSQFAGAIAALSQNVHEGGRDVGWLGLCLVSIEKACTPPEKRSEDFALIYKKIEDLTYEQLIDDVRKLGGQV